MATVTFNPQPQLYNYTPENSAVSSVAPVSWGGWATKIKTPPKWFNWVFWGLLILSIIGIIIGNKWLWGISLIIAVVLSLIFV